MRTYGRTAPDEYGKRRWVVVETDDVGSNDYVYITALIQTLKLSIGESPFYANFGLPVHASIVQQLPPDYAVAFTQAYYAKYFASLLISKQKTSNPATPIYNVSIIRNNGSIYQEDVAL